MANAKQQADWLLVAIPTAWIVNSNGVVKKPVAPLKIIPRPFHPPREPVPKRSPEQLAFESKRAWALMDMAFRGW